MVTLVSCFTARVEEVKAPEIAQTAGSIPTGFAHRDALPAARRYTRTRIKYIGTTSRRRPRNVARANDDLRSVGKPGHDGDRDKNEQLVDSHSKFSYSR